MVFLFVEAARDSYLTEVLTIQSKRVIYLKQIFQNPKLNLRAIKFAMLIELSRKIDIKIDQTISPFPFRTIETFLFHRSLYLKKVRSEWVAQHSKCKRFAIVWY